MYRQHLRTWLFERFEPRLPLATTVLDLNPGPESSTPAVHAQFGDYIYVSADTGAGRRLLRTDGETFADLGPGLGSTVIRGETLYGIEDVTRNVETVNLATGERTTFSTERGATWVSGATIGWYTPVDAIYHDIDGRNYDWDDPINDTEMRPWFASGDATYAAATYGGNMAGVYRCDITCVFVSPESAYYRSDGYFLLANGTDVFTVDGVVVGTYGDKFDPDTNGGWWTVRGEVLSHYVGAEVDQWTIPGLKYVAYAAPDRAIAAIDVDGLGYDPFLVTTDVINLGDMNSTNLGGWLVGDRIFLDNSLLLVGTQLLPMQAQSYPWHVTDKDIGFFWHDTPETGAEMETRLILAGDSSWVSGDFNGDGEFDSGDLVDAFVLGRLASSASGRAFHRAQDRAAVVGQWHRQLRSQKETESRR